MTQTRYQQNQSFNGYNSFNQDSPIIRPLLDLLCRVEVVYSDTTFPFGCCCLRRSGERASTQFSNSGSSHQNAHRGGATRMSCRADDRQENRGPHYPSCRRWSWQLCPRCVSFAFFGAAKQIHVVVGVGNMELPQLPRDKKQCMQCMCAKDHDDD